jgi:hypothetical protein
LTVTRYEQELNEPPPEDLQALEQMLGQQQWVNAEIAARMMVNGYPGHLTYPVAGQHIPRAVQVQDHRCARWH